MKFYIRTLGCKMNWLDAARVSAALQEAGHHQVEQEAEADYVLVNSCTVTAEADRKSRQMAQSALRADKSVAVIGCGPRADHAGWRGRMPEAVLLEEEAILLRRFGVEEAETAPVESSRVITSYSIHYTKLYEGETSRSGIRLASSHGHLTCWKLGL